MTMDNVEDVYGLSPMQQGMLFHCISEPNSGVFVEQICFALTGDLHVDVLRQSWDEVARRHPVLRQSVLWDGLDEPLQVVFNSAEVPWKELDWRGISKSKQAAKFKQVREYDRRQGVDLSSAPLMRMLLIRESENRSRVMWTFHHISLDGWSGPILLKEWFETYEALLEGRRPVLPPPFLYRDYIAWLKAKPAGSDETFWREYLQGFCEPNNIGCLPNATARRSDQKAENPYQQSENYLSEQATQTLLRTARDCRVTLNTMIQGAWGLLLSRYTDSQDVVFGATSSGRPVELPGVEAAVGLFINTLPLRLGVDEQMSLRDWIATVQASSASIKDYEYSSLAKVQSWSEVGAGRELFDSVVVFENYPDGDDLGSALSQLKLSECEYFEQSNYPLALLVVPGDKLRVILIHDSSRVSSIVAQGMLVHLVNLLVGFAESPEKSLRTISMFDAAEQQRLLGQGVGYCASPPEEETLLELFEKQIAANPEKTAATFSGQSITYGQWETAAESLALRLRQAGVVAGQRVGLHVERSIELVVGLLAILKVGGVYVPIDPAYPQQRKQYIVDDAKIEVLLTQKRLRKSSLGLAVRQLAIDDEAADPKGNALVVPHPEVQTADDDAAAYVIYTSGSTGKPKGVSVSHRSVVHSTVARFSVYGNQPRAFLLLSSIAFDSSLVGLFWTLAAGGEVVLPEQGMEQDMDCLEGLIFDRKVSHLLCLPSLYRLILENCHQRSLDCLQTVIVAGEPCRFSTWELHQQTVPRSELFNEYGPTEASVWATVHQFSDTDTSGPVPIGKPIPRMNVYLLDRLMRLTPLGTRGEIYLSGVGLAEGYLNAASLTDERFTTCQLPGLEQQRLYRTGDLAYFREDGNLVFAGRSDGQVKIRGHRIELSEIEDALGGFVGVRECVVTAQESEKGEGKRLVAYVVRSSGRSVQEQAIRDFLAIELPIHMIPSAFVYVDAIPHTVNGKVDFPSLPKPTAVSSSKYIDPVSKSEVTLAKIWAEVIGVERVGTTDNFFSLGGDSILSIQMISRARQAGIHLQPKHIAKHPTIAELALVADLECKSSSDTESTGEFLLSPIQHWFFENQFARPDHWNLTQRFELPEEYDAVALELSLGQVIAAHELLHAKFIQNKSGRWSGVIPDDKPRFVLESVAASLLDRSDFEAKCLQIQQSLSVERGPVFRVVCFQNETGADRLLFVVHHLVVDAVSWQVILEDIESSFSNNGVVERPSCSFARYSQTLLAQADAEQVLTTAEKWNAISAGAEQINWPLVDSEVPTTEASMNYLDTVVDAETTQALRSTANTAFNTTAQQLLVATVALSLAKWTDADNVPLVLESHGRNGDLVGDLDLTRTVGWLTELYPVLLSVDGKSIERTVKAVKDELNQMGGISGHYGLLRHHASPDNRLKQSLAVIPVLFNYLGIRAEQKSPLRWVDGADATSRAPENSRQHAIEINAVIKNDQLHMQWAFCRQRIERSTMEGLAADFSDQLRELLAICESAERGLTPSDFSDVDLSQEELDDFLAEME